MSSQLHATLSLSLFPNLKKFFVHKLNNAANRLSTDFTAERKRHAQSRRKLANGVRQYFKTRESRALAALTQAESKRRRLAAKLGRSVQKWWSKMDQIVTYQQKLTYDQERQQAMNRKLVKLVRQTETYTKSLVGGGKHRSHTSGRHAASLDPKKRKREQGVDFDINDDDPDNYDEQLRQLQIEEALAVGQRKRKIHDYARLARLAEDQEQSEGGGAGTTTSDTGGMLMLGESGHGTTDDSLGSDATYEPGSDSSLDDETTLEQAEREEQYERNLTNSLGNDKNVNQLDSFVADPVEQQKLLQEATMDIEEVLERLRQEPPTLLSPQNLETTDESTPHTGRKRVHFSEDGELQDQRVPPTNDETTKPSSIADPGEDADDDGDASDVDDFVDSSPSSPLQALASLHNDNNNSEKDDDNDEFVDDGVALDDETTMEEEKQLPQEMTAQEEIALLEEENNMSVEELRKKYAGSLAPQSNDKDESDEDTATDTSATARKRVPKPNPESEHKAMESDGETDDPEFEPKLGDDVDDETTMEAEERLGRDMSYDEELAMLQNENDIPVEELRAMYARMTAAESNGPQEQADAAEGEASDKEDAQKNQKVGFNQDGTGDEEDDDAEYQPGEAIERDDETTIEAEEKMGQEMSYEEELALLKSENEVSVDELRAMYAGAFEGAENDETDGDGEAAEVAPTENQMDWGPEAGSKMDMESTDVPASNKRQREEGDDEEDIPQSETSKKSRLGIKTDVGAEALSALEQYAELAKSTMATRPFLLARWVKLREYQQVGLNWLISMQSRRLNGILADEVSCSVEKDWRCPIVSYDFRKTIDGAGQDTPDDRIGSLSRFLQGNMGTASDCCANVSHCELGD